jgi:hypothetical protein
MSDRYPSPKTKSMTEVNSAESYYQYRIESDAKIGQMTATSNRLNTKIKEMKLQSAIEKQVRDPDVSNLIFNLTKGSAIETDNGFNVGDRSLPEAIANIQNTESLQRFFAKVDVPESAPKRVFNQGWDY